MPTMVALGRPPIMERRRSACFAGRQAVRRGLWHPLMQELCWSAAAVVLAAAAGLVLTALAPLPNVSMVFLLAVLFAAARFGLRPALFASALSFLAYNFFFIEPLHTFSVAEPHEWLTLFVLLAVAVLTSAIAGRARDQARTALERARLAEEVNAARAAAE